MFRSLPVQSERVEGKGSESEEVRPGRQRRIQPSPLS